MNKNNHQAILGINESDITSVNEISDKENVNIKEFSYQSNK
jgi:hypothetical protein